MGISVEVQTRPAGEVVIVAQGELQQSTVPQFRQAVTEALATGADRLVIDLSQITFIDSSGLSALVGARHAGDRAACRISLAGVSPALRRTLNTTGLTDYLNATESS
jgi:anti-anti-sigma factor